MWPRRFARLRNSPVLRLAAGLWLAGSGAFAAAERPNILFLVPDDLGYADLGVNGCTDFATPQIDSLARQGVRFTSGYVSAPVCSPSRAGLMTGRWQTRFGHEFNHPLADRSPVGLPTRETLAPGHFRAAGYVTGHVGKWHLGNPKEAAFSPQARGFAESAWFPGQKKLPPLQVWRHATQGRSDERYVDEAIAGEAASFVTRHRTAPWFLYVAFLTPHQPLEYPPGADAAFARIADPERRNCAAMMTLLDGAVGRILAALRATGQEERTLVVFLSDNGAPPRNGSRNTPLRGHKGTTWEGGLRVPFVLQWKKAVPAGQVIDVPVTSIDLLPTALGAAGLAVPAALDGVNLLPLLTGGASPAAERALFWRYGEQWAIRAGDWKLVRAAGTGGDGLRLGLFNLRDDPGESRDRSGEEPALARDLRARWEAWNRGNVAALWGDETAPAGKR